MSVQQRSVLMRRTVYKVLQQEGLFCNATLKAGDVEFPVHQTILCECSPYFQALFERWTNTDQVFYIPLVSPDMMRLIVKFAYTSFVDLTENNVQQLMITADMLNIMGIVQACADFISERLCPQNCVGIWQFTDIFHNSSLRGKAFCYIMGHFEEVAHSEEFLQLSLEEHLEIIDKDELNVTNESSVFEAILRWIAHVPKERERHIAVLISQVRLGVIDMEYIVTKVITNKLLRNNTEIRELLRCPKYFKWNNKYIPLFGVKHTPRVPNSLLILTGGWTNNKNICDIEAYNPLTDHWIHIPDKMEHRRAYHGTVFLNGYIYCIGGSEKITFFKSMDRLDLMTHTWQEMAPMHYRRCYVSVTTLNGFIYAIGGSDGYTQYNSAERYCPETNQWTIVAPMNTQRSDASCTVLNNKIYVCGGFSGTDNLQTAECYDPETNKWTMINPMTTRRRGLGVVAYNNQVYAVGGFDGVNKLSTVETYIPETNTWHMLSPMLIRRSNFCLEVIQDQFYVLGGCNVMERAIECREVYCPRTDIWSEISQSKISRTAASSCVVSGIPNMAEFVQSANPIPYLHFSSFR